jgi:hypothetical protein
MASGAATNVEEYLAELAPERVAVIERVRELVLDALPDGGEESMNFGMIASEISLERDPNRYTKQPLMFAALAAQSTTSRRTWTVSTRRKRSNSSCATHMPMPTGSSTWERVACVSSGSTSWFHTRSQM